MLNEKRKKKEKEAFEPNERIKLCVHAIQLHNFYKEENFLLDLCSFLTEEKENLNANFSKKMGFSFLSSCFRSPQILQAKVQFKKDIERIQKGIKEILLHDSRWILALLCAQQKLFHLPNEELFFFVDEC